MFEIENSDTEIRGLTEKLSLLLIEKIKYWFQMHKV